ncbi:hypothetical protein [Corallococcus macrosporus]|uniref:DoxX family protein n=1 Tax=Corallococcus macrosporus DSM 14697 TaxID=1189310 RepID=A0A250JVZ4_9BACT|nr:hypothetical protein [Corallococcus macrosporus]ATB47521.1 hypothetical protein MYMAC_003135 [Corallococcus macrosporus DSM 14697]
MHATEAQPSPPVPPAPELRAEAPAGAPSTRGWGVGQRIAFRWAFIYLTLYGFPFPLDLIPGFDWLHDRLQAFWESVIPWVGARVLGLDIVDFPFGGTSDTTFDYVKLLLFAVTAVVVTLVWSVSDRCRGDDSRLHEGFRVYLRYMVATAMLSYGLAKVFATQFRFPELRELLRPMGDASPMGLMWDFMGYSTGYSAFTGGAEVLGGVLLCFRRTTTLGALVVVGVMSNVVMLNFAFDVSVKMGSSHLLLMAVFLVVPDVRRLVDFLVLNRPTEPVTLRTPFAAPWMEWGRRTVKCLFLGWCAVSMTAEKLEHRRLWGEDAPRSELYGIYTVESFEWGGQEVPPMATDATRWKRVVFEASNNGAIQRMNDAWMRYRVNLRPAEQGLTLSAMENGHVPMILNYSRPDAESLVLEGFLGDRSLRVLLVRRDASELELVKSRGFRWISETPRNK